MSFKADMAFIDRKSKNQFTQFNPPPIINIGKSINIGKFANLNIIKIYPIMVLMVY